MVWTLEACPCATRAARTGRAGQPSQLFAVSWLGSMRFREQLCARRA